MNFEVFNILVTTITTIFTSVTLVYKLIIKNGNKKEQKYYEDLLKPFVKILCENKQKDAIKFVRSTLDFSDDCIPKYISYLIRANNSENKELRDDKIKKVMICDYLDIYENDKKIYKNGINFIYRFVYYIYIVLGILSLTAGSALIGVGLMSAIISSYNRLLSSNIEIIAFTNTIITGGALITFSFLAYLFIDLWNYDRYTLSNKKIERIINKRIKSYEKINKKFFY